MSTPAEGVAMFTYLQRLIQERNGLTESMQRMSDNAATEDRDLTDTERRSVTDMQTRCGELDSQIEQAQASIESQRAYASLMQRVELTEREPAEDRALPSRQLVAVGAGQGFVESRAFTDYRGRGVGEAYEAESFLETRAPIMTSDLNIQPFRWSGPATPPVISPLLDVCATVRVSSGVVEWVQIGADPIAAVVAEGQPKPEATFTMTPQSSTLETLAHWIAVTRQALDDAAYLRSLIETKLRNGLLRKVEADVASAIIAAWPAAGAVHGATLLEAIRVGIAEVQSNGFRPNAVLLNPADWAALDVAVMVESVDGPLLKSSFWGLTPIASAAIPEGTAYVGDWSAAMTVFDRGVSSVFLTDSHAAYFISNTLVILAETRVKSAATELGAAVSVGVTAGP